MTRCIGSEYVCASKGEKEMINLFEVAETNEMIAKENLDVRTITLGISHLDCTDIRDRHGIREPLYLTALRYAGVPIREELEPQHVESLRLSGEHKEQVRAWYRDNEGRGGADAQRRDILSVENVSFGYTPEVQNLKNVSFSIKEGEMVSIVGKTAREKAPLPSWYAASRSQRPAGSVWRAGICQTTRSRSGQARLAT